MLHRAGLYRQKCHTRGVQTCVVTSNNTWARNSQRRRALRTLLGGAPLSAHATRPTLRLAVAPLPHPKGYPDTVRPHVMRKLAHAVHILHVRSGLGCRDTHTHRHTHVLHAFTRYTVDHARPGGGPSNGPTGAIDWFPMPNRPRLQFCTTVTQNNFFPYPSHPSRQVRPIYASGRGWRVYR